MGLECFKLFSTKTRFSLFYAFSYEIGSINYLFWKTNLILITLLDLLSQTWLGMGVFKKNSQVLALALRGVFFEKVLFVGFVFIKVYLYCLSKVLYSSFNFETFLSRTRYNDLHLQNEV